MRAALALVAVALAAVLAPTAGAEAGRIAVGVLDGVAPETLAPLVEQAAGVPVDRSLEPIGVLLLDVADVEAARAALGAIPGVEYVEELTEERRLAFQPDDTYAEPGPQGGPALQWYLSWIRAFDFWDGLPPEFANRVRVAVVDSGIDLAHPDLQGRVAVGRSFVPGRWDVDQVGHGTMVAGEIAAITNNALGIAGVGLPVELVVAKVVKRVGGVPRIDVVAEAKAIQWAVRSGHADVVNLSLGGERDPRDPKRDQYSQVEQDAIDYAYGHGAVVVAAGGNSPSGTVPYHYASYPAALPHVLGVGAIQGDGRVARFSNRDLRFIDLAAPGVGIVSTMPPGLSGPTCPAPGYSLQGCPSLDAPSGTSYSAPLVAAAAATLIAVAPNLGFELAPSQVMQLLQASTSERPADGRNEDVGNGILDVAGALTRLNTGPVPPADADEPNDDAGPRAWVLPGRRVSVQATIDWYDDPNDVYRVYLRHAKPVTVRVAGLATKATLVVWPPGTVNVTDVTQVAVRSGRVIAYKTARAPVLRVEVPSDGWYFVELKARARAGYQSYRLTVEPRR